MSAHAPHPPTQPAPLLALQLGHLAVSTPGLQPRAARAAAHGHGLERGGGGAGDKAPAPMRPQPSPADDVDESRDDGASALSSAGMHSVQPVQLYGSEQLGEASGQLIAQQQSSPLACTSYVTHGLTSGKKSVLVSKY